MKRLATLAAFALVIGIGAPQAIAGADEPIVTTPPLAESCSTPPCTSSATSDLKTFDLKNIDLKNIDLKNIDVKSLAGAVRAMEGPMREMMRAMPTR
jgi:hypothetical protein